MTQQPPPFPAQDRTGAAGYQPPPAQYGGPQWGNRGGHEYRKKGLSGLFFSS